MGRDALARKARARGAPWSAFAVPLFLLPLGLIAYANSLDVPFLLDDEPYILGDGAASSIAQVVSAERPVVAASLALNRAVGGLGVRGYHLVNVLLHVLCGLAVYALARYTFGLPATRARFAAYARPLAAVTAAIFLLHPVQVESVTYVIQRAEILAAIALLGSLPVAAALARGASRRVYLPALLLLGGLGVLSKPTVVVWPFLFVLYDWCLVAEGRLRTLARHWPIHLTLTGFAAAGLLWASRHPDPAAGFNLAAVGPWQYLGWQARVVPYYLRLVVVPDRLCFDCGYLGPWPVETSMLAGRVWLPAFGLAAGVAGAWRLRARFPLATFALLGTAVALAPSSSFFPLTDAYVEHRLYVPVALLSLLAVSTVFWASEEAVRRAWLGTRTVRVARTLVAVGACGVLLSLTIARNQVFRDPLRLWQDSLAKAPQNSRTQYNLGNLYLARREYDLAVARYRESVRLDPTQLVGFMNLGWACTQLGRYPEALGAYGQALQRDPALPRLHRNLSLVHARLGDMPSAVAAAERAVALEPDDPGGRKLLAGLYVQLGRNEDALRQYRAVTRLDPRDRDAQRRIVALGGS